MWNDGASRNGALDSPTRSTREARGPCCKLLAQRVVLVGGARRHDFNVAVFAVAHPSGHAELRCLALHEPAEADTLHASGYNIATSFEGSHEKKRATSN
jgi:hypothetical protein